MKGINININTQIYCLNERDMFAMIAIRIRKINPLVRTI
jgi:hypothetical protein